MSEAWIDTSPPDAPVTVTLPRRVYKRVLGAVTRGGHALAQRGTDSLGIEIMAYASKVIGDALEAPPHRRFVTALRHAIVAVNADDFVKTARSLELDPNVQPIFVDSVAAAYESGYVGYTVSPRATYGLANLPEILAIVADRTFPR